MYYVIYVKYIFTIYSMMNYYWWGLLGADEPSFLTFITFNALGRTLGDMFAYIVDNLAGQIVRQVAMSNG